MSSKALKIALPSRGQVLHRQLTDWSAVDALTDGEIVSAALSDPDAHPLTEEQLRECRRLSTVPGNTIIEKCRALANEPEDTQPIAAFSNPTM